MSLRIRKLITRGIRCTLLLCLHLLCMGKANGQLYSSVHYNTKTGLTSDMVYDLTQDSRGFMWFATESGLVRFDGKTFKTFTTKDGLPDNAIMKVYADQSGRVYLNPFTHGLYYFYEDSFYKVPVPERYKSNLAQVERMYGNGRELFITGRAVSYVLDSTGIVALSEKYGTRQQLTFARVYDTFLVAVSRDTVYYFYESGRRRSYYSNHQSDIGVVYNEQGESLRLRIPPGSAFVPREYLPGQLVVGHLSDAVHIYNIATRELLHDIKIGRPSSAVLDNEQNLWISTTGNGIYRFPSFSFRNLKFGSETSIYSLENWQGKVQAGGEFSRIYTLPPGDLQPEYTTTEFSSFLTQSENLPARRYKTNRIYVIRAFGNELYIGTDGFFLRTSGSGPPTFRGLFPVKDIDADNNSLLVSTGNSVCLYNRANLDMIDTLLGQRATCGAIYKGDYYVGTLGGLVKIDSGSGRMTELFQAIPALKGRIVGIRRGADDDLWIATSGSGLVRFKDGKVMRVLSEKDGLTSDICTSLCMDGRVLWLGTSMGLNRINAYDENPNVLRLTSANGLAADFINSVLVTDSTVYAGTAEGITAFSKNVVAEKSVCLLHIMQVSANNEKLGNQGLYSFPHNVLNIQVEFTAVSFKSSGDITYYYQLKGLEDKWNTTTTNFVNFPTLAPGNYTLLVKAVNKFGVESEIQSIQITVRPAWWQTWAFRIGALLLLIGLVFFIYWYNVRNIKRQGRMRRDIEVRFAALEQKALQAQMNPHFIFNCLNSIQTYILNLDVEGANNYLTSFASLIRQTLENSMQPLISMASEIKYLDTYMRLERLRFRDKFDYRITVDESIDKNHTFLPGMLLQPYLENAIRHGVQHRKDNNGLISLTIHKTDTNHIVYTISDNGVGRKQAQALKSSQHIEYQSRGTSISESRIAAINNQFNTQILVETNDITDSDGTVIGTKVIVSIPPL